MKKTAEPDNFTSASDFSVPIVKDLPPHRKPVPYDDSTKARAYRAGYKAWPDGRFERRWDYEQASAWLEGWSDAHRDASRPTPEKGQEKEPVRWRGRVNLHAHEDTLVFFGYARQPLLRGEEDRTTVELEGRAELPAEEVGNLLSEIEARVAQLFR